VISKPNYGGYICTCDQCGATVESPGIFRLYAILQERGWVRHGTTHICMMCRQIRLGGIT